MDMVTRVKTWLHGEPVGADAYGNRYFQAKRAPAAGRRRRWVVYAGTPDASKVPPEWHAWLHYTVDAPLTPVARPWIRPHQPNLTGTAAAWRPAGSQLRGGVRARATGDYESWSPEQG
jgi:NADH:ubiquinone oxidoreductase subunit